MSCDETMAVRRRLRASLSPSLRRTTLQTRSLTNSLMASATLVDAAMADRHEANDEPDPSAASHMVRKASIVRAPEYSGAAACALTCRGSKGNDIAATKRLAFPSK